MRFETFRVLMDICGRWSEYGKIIQLLLAISFDRRRGGFSVQNRSTEGVDLEMVRGADKFAIEVKTTTSSYVTLYEKDISGLQAKFTADSYTPAVAALALQRSSNWIIANATRLRPGDYTIQRLSLDAIPDLESLAKIQFEAAVTELHDKIMSPPDGSPLNYLSSVLLEESQ